MTPARATLGNALLLLALAALGLWLALHQTSPWPAPTAGAEARWLAGLALTSWLLLCVIFLGKARTAVDAIQPAGGWWVIHASQTGFAVELAQRTVAALHASGQSAQACDITRFDPAQLPAARCLFIASTTGEGDPPDPALGFVESVLSSAPDLRATRYAVLALGDRSYARFCAFDRRLDDWLQACGARPLFDRIDVDNGDPGALRHWQHQLGVATGHTVQADWERPRYQRWTLAERAHLNPGSAGDPAYLLTLRPESPADLRWQAGDIAEIGPRNPPGEVQALLAESGLDPAAAVLFEGNRLPLAEALARTALPDAATLAGQSAAAVAALLQPLPHREYSIASIPEDGVLELLVRRLPRRDGRPGLGSGWLCLHAEIGQAIDLRIRANPTFHLPAADVPLILIGNGTGLAGLRAHLKARIARGIHRNWLLFGERSAAHDAFFGAELDAWRHAGQLEGLDRVYSRDGGPQRYVQDALRAQGDRLRQWLADGASIHVCGSLAGMAPGVDATLRDLLGEAAVTRLLHAGRYRRDVY